jgi:hypothetical protein
MDMFAVKSNALFVALVFNATDLKSFSLEGYTVPSGDDEAPSGLRSWPALVTVPAVCLDLSLSPVVSLSPWLMGHREPDSVSRRALARDH